MKIDYWRQLRDSAESYDLELLGVTGVYNQLGVVIAVQALQDIDQQLRAAGHGLGTCVEIESGIMVTARRCYKNRDAHHRTNWRKEIDSLP